MTDLEKYTKLRAGIQQFLDGDYDNPRKHRPATCKHGSEYYQECAQCDEEHFISLLESVDIPF